MSNVIFGKSAPQLCRMLVKRGVSTGTAAIYTPPSLKDIPRRWPIMKNVELQEEIKEYLDWKMQGPWNKLTKDEQVSAFYIAYGEWGPRGKTAKGQPAQQVSVSYFIFRVMFNVTLLSALGVAYINWKRDKEHAAESEESSPQEISSPST